MTDIIMVTAVNKLGFGGYVLTSGEREIPESVGKVKTQVKVSLRALERVLARNKDVGNLVIHTNDPTLLHLFGFGDLTNKPRTGIFYTDEDLYAIERIKKHTGRFTLVYRDAPNNELQIAQKAGFLAPKKGPKEGRTYAMTGYRQKTNKTRGKR